MNSGVWQQLERQGFRFTGRRLGEGGFGSVEVASFGGIDRAVKISKEPIEASIHVEKELQRLEYIKQLTQHRSIVGLILYQAVEVREQGRPQRYLVTVWELADASLADRRDLISRDELLDYLQDTAEALDYLHGEGIHHRDVKPHNILIFDGDGHARLGDLGLARMVERTTTATRVVSLGFTPPEILTSGRSYPTSDLFSLACTYVWMRTGSFPGELFVEDPDGWERIDGVPAEENKVLLKALDPDHKQRPAEGIVNWVERLRPCGGDGGVSCGAAAAEDDPSNSEPLMTQPRSASDSVEALMPDAPKVAPRNHSSKALVGTGFVCVVAILIILFSSMPAFRRQGPTPDETVEKIGQDVRALSSQFKAGEPNLRLTIGGVERQFVHSDQSLEWSISPTEFPTPKHKKKIDRVAFRFGCDVLRSPYQTQPWLHDPVVEMRVANPASEGMETKRLYLKPAPFTDVAFAPTKDFQLYVDAQTFQNRYPAGVRVVVTLLDPGSMVGGRPDDLGLGMYDTEDAGSDIDVWSLLSGRYNDPRFSYLELNFSSDVYQAAIEACEETSAEYDRALIRVPAKSGWGSIKLIPYSLECQIFNRLHVALTECQEKLYGNGVPVPSKDSPEYPSFIKTKALLALLNPSDGRDWGRAFLEEAAEHNDDLRTWVAFEEAKTHLKDANLPAARDAVETAIRHRSANAHAYALRAQVRSLLGEPGAEEDLARAKEFDPDIDKPRRTLPWLLLPPIDEKIRDLTRVIPELGDNTP